LRLEACDHHANGAMKIRQDATMRLVLQLPHRFDRLDSKRFEQRRLGKSRVEAGVSARTKAALRLPSGGA
jgi:hypothetical protein